MQEYLRNIIPIFTFFAGIIAVPFIEERKHKAKAKSVLDNLKIELQDEIEDLPRKIKLMANSLSALKAFKSGSDDLTGPLKYVPRDSSCYFLKDAIECSFQLLTKQQRYAIKSLKIQIEATNEYIKDINLTELSEENLDKLIYNCKKYLFTGSCMLNTMRIIANCPKAQTELTDKEVIEKIFKEFSVELSLEDIKIIETKKFSGQ